MATEYAFVRRMPPWERIRRIQLLVTPYTRGRIHARLVYHPVPSEPIARTPTEITEAKGKIALSVGIDVSTAGDHIVIPGVTNMRIHLCGILIIARGEVIITLKSGNTRLSGPMLLGAFNQPRGFSFSFGDYPVVCGKYENFIINLSTDIAVQGLCSYFIDY